MKNKKFIAIIAVVVMSGLLLTAGAMAANPTGSAYEQFKSLLDQDHERIENATLNMSMAVVDNGKSVIALDGSMKMETGSKKMSGTFRTSGKATKSFEIYKNNDDVLLRLAGSENWYKSTNKEYSEDEEEFRRNFRRDFDNDRKDDFGENKQLRDALLDTIIGDYRDQINMTESNGLRTLSLSLNEGNMPILLQTAFQMSDRHKNKECEAPENLSLLPQELQDAFADMKHCEYDVELVDKKLEGMEISITVDQQNHPVEMGMSMVCTGTDIDGAEHVLDIDLSMRLSDVGTTVVDEANPDPASVTTIDSGVFEGPGMRHRIRD